MKAWIYQDDHQVKRHGTARASWYVGYYDTDGKKRWQRCGPGSFSKIKADKFRRKVEAELLTGTYQGKGKKTWDEFVEEYKSRILSGLACGSRDQVEAALEHFKRIAKPAKIVGIHTQTIDDYIATRRTEAGKKKGDLTSPATINKELRHLKAALRVASA